MINVWTTVSDNDNNYELSALLINGEYYMPSLKFLLDGDEVEVWDFEEFLYNEVYQKYLLSGISNDELEDTFSNVKDTILEMFNTADKLGFFKNINKEIP